MKTARRDVYHMLFEYSILLKALFAMFEVVSGLLLRLIPFDAITRFMLMITPDDGADGMPGFFDRHLSMWEHHISMSSLHYAGLYLLSHGAIKLLLITGLWKKTLWMYPLSIVVFMLFIVYQMHHFLITGAWGMVVLSIFDTFVIYLIGREYSHLKAS